MAVHDARAVELLVFTFKEGLLSRVAHDLKLRVEELELTVETGADGEVESVRLRVNPGSLRVVCAMRDGRENLGALSPKDLRDIDKNIAADVLHPTRFASISFDSTEVLPVGDAVYRVLGELLLHGVQRRVEGLVERLGDHWQTEVSLHQPDFDIKPFSALLGSLKVRPEVRVRIRVSIQ